MLNLETVQMPSTLFASASTGKREEKVTSGGFDRLLNVIEGVNHQQVTANELMSNVILGKSEDTHGAIIALEKASIQMELLVKVRTELTETVNKLINIQL